LQPGPKSYKLCLFDEPLCLFECACRLLPKDLDQLNSKRTIVVRIVFGEVK
jgi:hypothetical protein